MRRSVQEKTAGRSGRARCLFLAMSALLAVCAVGARGGTYYVSGAGDDGNSGTDPSRPWQTFAPVHALSAAELSGSSVLLRRGDLFRGQIQFSGDPAGVLFGAYGTGEAPVISGSVELTGWVPFRDGIYRCDASGLLGAGERIHHLFVDGSLMTIARYPDRDAPDAGWLKVDASSDKRSFTDAALALHPRNAPGYWVGADVKVRTFSWLFEVREVARYAEDGTITLNADLTETMAPYIREEWGYYLDNKLEELDREEEWYFDDQDSAVYLHAPGGADPNTLLVEGSVRPFGIRLFWHDHDVTIENLTFRHQVEDGINVNSCDRAVIRDNVFAYCGRSGVNIEWNAQDVQIRGNRFDRMLDYAIVCNGNIDAGPGFVIEGNTITNTALTPGYGGSGVTHSSAVWVPGYSGIQIRGNVIEDTGYVGILLEGEGHTVERNVIRRSLLTLNDGGGILLGADSSRIASNVITDSYGNIDPSAGLLGDYRFPHLGMGIAFLAMARGNVIENNTVADNRHYGLYVERGAENVIQHNVFYNNRVQVYLHGREGDVPDNRYRNVLTGNVLYALSPEQLCLQLEAGFDFGTFDNARYCGAYGDVVIRDGDDYLTLEQWKAAHPDRDPDAGGMPRRLTRHVSAAGDNLVANGDFPADASGWWGGGAASVAHDADRAGMRGGSLRVEHVGGGSGSVSGNTLSLVQGQHYRLRFSCVADALGDFQVFFFREDLPSWTEFVEKRFGLYPAATEHTFVFQWPHETTHASSVHFSLASEDPAVFWLDDIVVQPVEAPSVDPREQSLLLTNATPEAATTRLNGRPYTDLDGTPQGSSTTLPPFESRVLLLRDPVFICPAVLVLLSE